MIEHSIFSVMAALIIVEILFRAYNGLKMMENEAYWLTDLQQSIIDAKK